MCYYFAMSQEEKDAVAQSMVAKRWAKTTPEQRSALARKLNEARWGKKAAPKKAVKKKAAK
jgi:hypothetical protein